MQTMERTAQRGLRYEELNRARQEIQTKWTEAERSAKSSEIALPMPLAPPVTTATWFFRSNMPGSLLPLNV